MFGSANDVLDPVQKLKNPLLVQAMSLHQDDADTETLEQFFSELCKSKLIVFSNTPIEPSSSSAAGRGYTEYGIGSQLSIAMITDAFGRSFMPAFSSIDAYHRQNVLDLEYSIAMPATQLLDIITVVGADCLLLDYGSRHCIEVPYDAIYHLVGLLRQCGALDGTPCVERELGLAN